MLRGVGICTLSIALAFVFAVPAAGSEAPPIEDVSAIDQYRESVPTASGRRALGERSGKPHPLSAATRERLRVQGGDDAALLEQLATSPALGAAKTAPRSPDDVGHARDRSAAGAAAAAVREDNGAATTLMVVFAGVALAAAGAAVFRQRPRRA